MHAMEQRMSPLISVSDVRQKIRNQGVVIVDARGGGDAYQRYLAGHVQGAMFLNLETDLSDKGADPAKGGRHPLPIPNSFGMVLGRAGITPSTELFVYDDKAGANAAARFWWMMRAAGHQRVRVVDGGLQALREGGLTIVEGPSSPANMQSPYEIHEWQLPTADLEQVEVARKDSDWTVIDVRESYRYKGESEPIDLVAGHIPGAINVPFLTNLQANGHFRSADILAAQFSTALGGNTPRKVIVHCGSGVTACHTLLAMEVAGLPAASLYVGSWSEWSRNPKPISKGENP
jgi:thiosulfate/3-mercaptopyruvate sulfurtransferase